MNRLRRIFTLVTGLFVVGLPCWAGGPTSSLRTVEGRVATIDVRRGEGDLELLRVSLVTQTGQETALLLAPQDVFDEIGFAIQEGDHLRARVFVDDGNPAPVQKVQNLSQGTMVRLRTLHATPLWNAGGGWQGGPPRLGKGLQRRGSGFGRGPGR